MAILVSFSKTKVDLLTVRPNASGTQSTSSDECLPNDQAWQHLYVQLHELASRQMAGERPGNLLQTTAVMNEAWLRLAGDDYWRDRDSFLAAATVAMRRVLIDNARREKAIKRGGELVKQPLQEVNLSIGEQSYLAVEIHDALARLAEFDEEQAKALELMIFGGMTGQEVAKQMGTSPSTIDRRVRAAKAWLARELKEA